MKQTKTTPGRPEIPKIPEPHPHSRKTSSAG